jgi:hypothetical protein
MGPVLELWLLRAASRAVRSAVKISSGAYKIDWDVVVAGIKMALWVALTLGKKRLAMQLPDRYRSPRDPALYRDQLQFSGMASCAVGFVPRAKGVWLYQ